MTEQQSFENMTGDEKVTYLVNGLQHILFNISLEARHTLRQQGFTPETATQFKLLAMIEGQAFGQHDTSGAMDWLDHLKATLAEDIGVEGLYEDEDDEESDEDEEDEELSKAEEAELRDRIQVS
jgi:hypothetical protein